MQFNLQVTRESEQAVKVAIDNAGKRIVQGLKSGVRAAGIYVASYIKRELLSGWPVFRRSGNMSRAVFSRMEGDAVSVVGVGPEAPYARFVNDGTRPHLISARNGGVLAFTPAAGAIRASAFVSPRSISKVINQNVVFARVVHHPGTAPRKFMELGLTASLSEIYRIIKDRVARLMKA